MAGMINAGDYQVGEQLVFVASPGGSEYPVTVLGHNSLGCDLIVRWDGPAPVPDDDSTICLRHLAEVRRA